MFIRRALVEYPPRQPTADSLGEVEADDGHRYYVKGDAHGKMVRASEWIATHIAEDINIGAPTPSVLQRLDGTTVFGSRRLAGVADEVTTAAYLTAVSVGNQAVPAIGLTALLSSIYAFDLFINNDDRHLGNYLTIDDNGTRRLYCFDFSRALFWNGLTQVPALGTNTRAKGKLLRTLHGFDLAAAEATLDRLTGLTGASVGAFVNRMPPDWLPEPTRSDFIAWWSDGRRDTRVSIIRKGVQNGSFL
jgi:hypothetical protein